MDELAALSSKINSFTIGSEPSPERISLLRYDTKVGHAIPTLGRILTIFRQDCSRVVSRFALGHFKPYLECSDPNWVPM